MQFSHKLIALGIALVCGVSACTDPGETTGVAAATGGVLGAGLGAIVGSQTGDPGSGLVIGAVAGASTGAMVGNALESQQQAIRRQDETIQRQERAIATQRSELDELRRLNQDTVSFKSASKSQFSSQTPSSFGGGVRERDIIAAPVKSAANSSRVAEPFVPNQEAPRAMVQPSAVQSGAAKREVPAAPVVVSANQNLGGENDVPHLALPPSADQDGGTPETLTNDCTQAENEVTEAKSAKEPADKLFHFRRALRLCPSRAEYHVGLAEVYLTLNRKTDADFEFKEALSLDPNNAIAKRNVVGGGQRY